jgi:hypothetical protein
MMAKYYTKPQYNNLPAHIAQQLAALPALPASRGRGRGRGYVAPPLPVSLFFGKCY